MTSNRPRQRPFRPYLLGQCWISTVRGEREIAAVALGVRRSIKQPERITRDVVPLMPLEHFRTRRKLDALHQFDCLRANKSMMAWGVEPRVPFLDPTFMDVAMGIDATQKMVRNGRIEKHILREAFKGVLPDEILWRQKEQFSDGVGYGWIDGLKAQF